MGAFLIRSVFFSEKSEEFYKFKCAVPKIILNFHDLRKIFLGMSLAIPTDISLTEERISGVPYHGKWGSTSCNYIQI